MEVSSSSNETQSNGSSLAKNLNPDRYKERYGNKKFVNSKNKVTTKKVAELLEDPLLEDEPEVAKSVSKKTKTANIPLQESVEDVIKYVAQMEEEEAKRPQRFTRQVDDSESENNVEVSREEKRSVDKARKEEAKRAAQKEKAEDRLFKKVDKNLSKRIDEDYRRIAKEERKKEKEVTRARKEELKRRARIKEEQRKAEKKKNSLIKTISKNVKRNIKEEDKQLKKEAREKRKEQRKIKRARGKYIPHKRRSLLERFAHMIYYNHGGYDKYIYSNYEDLSPRQQKKWQTKIEAIQDTEHDIAMRAGWTSFKVLLAACGLALTCYSVKLVQQQFAETEARLQIERIQKQKEYSELEAKSHFFKLEDQEYLKSKMDIPEGATDEEILELMKEAYANLKPDIKQWIRDPEKVAAAKAKQQEEKETLTTNSSEGTIVADDGKEIGD